MLTEKSTGRRESSDSRQFVLDDVVGALESAGLPPEIKEAVKESLEGASKPESDLSDNARVILEKALLEKGRMQGTP